MEIIKIFDMPDEAYNKNEPWGIQKIENVEFDGKDKLPEKLSTGNNSSKTSLIPSVINN